LLRILTQIMNLVEKSLAVERSGLAASIGHLILRVVAGLMIFYVHGWHKLEGLMAYLQHGTPGKLAEEVAEMHFPAPFPSAVAATVVQFVCSLFIAAGLFTRINAVLLTGVLSVAILQNLLAGRDPQLAILYVLISFSMIFLGGGRFSLDVKWDSRKHQSALVFNAVT
jgi:putative oxidoreductase